MRKKAKKKGSSLKTILAMIPFMVIGGICGFLIAEFAIGNEQDGFADVLYSVALLLVGVYVGMFLQIAIHEAGHLVFGLLSGYGFSSYRIGSFMWLKENGKIRVRRYSLAGTGGQCLMTPPDLVDGKFPTVLYNLGGCIMNVIAGVLFLSVYFLLGRGSAFGLVCLMTAMIGFIYALVNGIPMNAGTVTNDGSNAWSLRKDPVAMRGIWLQLKINEQSAQGVRLKDMPDEWFVVPTDEEMKNTMTAAVGVLCCNRLFDQHRFAEADDLMVHLMEIESGIIGLHRDLLACDRITCCLLEGKEDEILNRMEEKDFVKFRKAMKTSVSIHRTEYVYALLKEKEVGKAKRAMENFEKCARNYPYPSDVAAERELMELANRKGEELPC